MDTKIDQLKQIIPEKYILRQEPMKDQSGQLFCKRRGNSIICFRKWK